MRNTNKLFQKKLLLWFHSNKRDLPFRDVKDPYKIWLSEVMLQQTQVNTVLPYFNKWIKKYPTIKSVANEDYDILLKYWEGLGYYSRCLNFYKACRIIVNNFDGLVPNKWSYLRDLPGVGDYTASAVLSIAFNQKYVAIDGNVKRVMSRYLGIKNVTSNNLKRIKTFLEEHILEKETGNFNQSIMELGAIICRPKNPKCQECPISLNCIGYLKIQPENYPNPKNYKAKPHHVIVAGIFWRNKLFYIQKRDENGMLGGLWEFPGGKVEKNETLISALNRKIKEECGVSPMVKEKVGVINHQYSHFSITFHVYNCMEEKKKIKEAKLSAWIAPEQISQYAFPKANHKIFKIISDRGWCA